MADNKILKVQGEICASDDDNFTMRRGRADQPDTGSETECCQFHFSTNSISFLFYKSMNVLFSSYFGRINKAVASAL